MLCYNKQSSLWKDAHINVEETNFDFLYLEENMGAAWILYVKQLLIIKASGWLTALAASKFPTLEAFPPPH